MDDDWAQALARRRSDRDAVQYCQIGDDHALAFRGTDSWICYYSWGLHLHDSLHELDAAYFDARRRRCHTSKDVGLDSSHVLPGLCIAWVVDTVTLCIRIQS